MAVEAHMHGDVKATALALSSLSAIDVLPASP